MFEGATLETHVGGFLSGWVLQTEDIPDGFASLGVEVVDIVDTTATFSFRENANSGTNLSVEDASVEGSESCILVPLPRGGSSEPDFDFEILD